LDPWISPEVRAAPREFGKRPIITVGCAAEVNISIKYGAREQAWSLASQTLAKVHQGVVEVHQGVVKFTRDVVAALCSKQALYIYSCRSP